MKNGYRVFDSDLHVIEPPDLWTRRLPPAFLDRGPIGLTRFALDSAVMIDGHQLPKLSPAAEQSLRDKRHGAALRFGTGLESGWDVRSQLQAMDAEGIDAAVLFPTRGLFAIAWDDLDAEFALAISRAYN